MHRPGSVPSEKTKTDINGKLGYVIEGTELHNGYARTRKDVHMRLLGMGHRNHA